MLKQARAVSFEETTRDVPYSSYSTNRKGNIDKYLDEGYIVVSSHVVGKWIEYIVQKEIEDD
ncbi:MULTISPECIES: hypothetical protein [Fructobacillus]|uniref:hypothetical protein n=1 Tax=Fructobacillus TaxID=559173 RepID=UPI0019445363|nr:hypothetical protein [Fructobacillus tropaeoli]GIC69592.1 hypothetical protein FT12353_02290 [Fructobacillus tropaeoli]CAK1226805.1 unnamed protein product [Fructobacillus cardui]